MKIVQAGPNYGKEWPSTNSVQNFDYNGFGCQMLEGFASYEVLEFIQWTMDPGILQVTCTDGVPRRIPSCQLSPELLSTFPKPPELDPFNGNGVLFGLSCKS